MTSKIPQNFTTVGAPQIASYNYFDLLKGIAYKILYPCDANPTVANTPNEYMLVENSTVYGAVGCTPLGVNTAGDIDFDIEVVEPILLEGDVYVNVALGHERNTTTASVSTTVTATLKHWDGTTETQLGTDTSIHSKSASSSGGAHSMACVKFNIARKRFKAGEFIRLTIATTAPGANNEIVIGHDPVGRTDLFFNGLNGDQSWDETPQSSVHIPIVVTE